VSLRDCCDIDSGELEAVAGELARLGAARVLEHRGGPLGVEAKTGRNDPVTVADRASEEAIVARLGTLRPDDGVLAEEGGRRRSASALRWVIDPLDGTVNCIYGRPDVAVSVACERLAGGAWSPVAGAVVDVGRGDLYSAAAGLGARRNGERISVSEVADLSMALVATGFSYSAASRSRQAAALALVVPVARDVRSSGSAALELCWVAAGLSDAYYEDELAEWDTAAGRLIVAEAGGCVTGLGHGGVVASGRGVHGELCAVLRPGGDRSAGAQALEGRARGRREGPL
jgi:myo-inositol-1(or 4)-monophosphatase